MEEGRSAFKIVAGKPTEEKPLGRPRCRREYNIRMGLKDVSVNTRNWTDFVQDMDY